MQHLKLSVFKISAPKVSMLVSQLLRQQLEIRWIWLTCYW